jgi:hypothetical protein
MLFLLRPPQTWMPYRPRRDPDQRAYHQRQLQQAYASTHRVTPAAPSAVAPIERSTVEALQGLAQLHRDGALTDVEFAAAKRTVLGLNTGTT